MSDYSRFFFADVGNWFSVMFRLRGSGLQLGPSRQPNSVPRSGQFEDRCLWKRSRRCRGSSFLNTFRELFCAVSSEDQELKDRRTEEHHLQRPRKGPWKTILAAFRSFGIKN